VTLADGSPSLYPYVVRRGNPAACLGWSTGQLSELSPAVLGGSIVLILGCSGSAATYTSDADNGSTHALVSVERRVVAGSAEPAQNRAFATFTRTPPEVDPAVVARVAGLTSELPEPGQCHATSTPPGTSLGPLRRVELLDAGDVALETAEGRVELAPRAFPAVTNLFAGVVYTTRERSAVLPDGVAYALSASGGALRTSLAVSAEAPQVLSGVTVDGVALDAGATLARTGSDLSWDAGAPRDIVYVTLTAEGHRVTCAFRDELGIGAIPASALPPGSQAGVALHRLRIVPLAAGVAESGVDAGELRFDFELAATLAVRTR
jgi:hypothetical protein